MIFLLILLLMLTIAELVSRRRGLRYLTERFKVIGDLVTILLLIWIAFLLIGR